MMREWITNNLQARCQRCLFAEYIKDNDDSFWDSEKYGRGMLCRRYPKTIITSEQKWCGEWADNETGRALFMIKM